VDINWVDRTTTIYLRVEMGECSFMKQKAKNLDIRHDFQADQLLHAVMVSGSANSLPILLF
jgi:hypothetical protein